MTHVAAGNHPAARMRAGHGRVERGHGRSGHQRGQVPLVVALYITSGTRAGRSHHRMILGSERQSGRGQRYGSQHPRGAGQVRVPEGGQRVM